MGQIQPSLTWTIVEPHTSTAAVHISAWRNGEVPVTSPPTINILTMQHLCLTLDLMLSHFCPLCLFSLSQAPGSFPALAHTDRMLSRLRDTQKLRGHISHSHMHTHRKHPRGHGNAGGTQHHRMNFDKHCSGYLQKVGMTNCHLKKNQKFWANVNLETVDTYRWIEKVQLHEKWGQSGSHWNYALRLLQSARGSCPSNSQLWKQSSSVEV